MRTYAQVQSLAHTYRINATARDFVSVNLFCDVVQPSKGKESRFFSLENIFTLSTKRNQARARLPNA